MPSPDKDLKVLINPGEGGDKPTFLSRSEGKQVYRFHQTVHNYAATPMESLENLAGKLGLGGLYIKDESHRFGLNSFKALGGTYAMAKVICNEIGLPEQYLDFGKLSSPETGTETGVMTFVTATDGNHGRGVAWAAQQLGQKAVVFLPKGTAQSRIDAITETGAEAIVTEYNYDDTVQLAIKQAEENDWHLVQDTAWEDYTIIPSWVMQGYITMIDEALKQLNANDIEKPTHVFLQAGVGSMPAAVLGYLVNIYAENAPKSIIVEPKNADCIFNSAFQRDGKRHPVEGNLQTIMAGLACGVPNMLAWDILRDFSSAFVSCEDYMAARGMRILGNPAGSDPRVISGESGAVGAGLLSLLMERPELDPIKRSLGFNEDSIVLIFNTEGDTDPDHYRQIVWDGKYPTPDHREISYLFE